MTLHVVIMAAGHGKRMKSQRPKVLHRLAGQPLLAHVLATAQALLPTQIIVVVGHRAEEVQQRFAHERITWVMQDPPLGTGDAVGKAVPHLPTEGVVLVLNGDVPLVPREALPALIAEAEAGKLALLSARTDDADGYGRIIRDARGEVSRIVEARDATPAELKVTEWNTGTLAAPAAPLIAWLARLDNNNLQQEFYLTDIVKHANADSTPVVATLAPASWRVEGANDRAQLAALERRYQLDLANQLLAAGVELADPTRIDVRGQLVAGKDVFIDVGCVFEGNVTLADDVSIGPYCIIKDASIGAGTRIEAFSHIEHAVVHTHARIGPYARLRPGTTLADDVHIGNFVEVKASRIGRASKANHLSYIGDSDIGSDCNIGAGTITCNYDGANKHKTVIGDNVHIGSDVQLVAPVTIATGATIGAGSTVWKDVESPDLVLNPKQQVIKPGWQRPVKTPKSA